ncbi:MAG: hypothetical protein KH110_08160 [Clostridiales bacterium]|jgi:hypothetical protein|uniref:Uncharacterized protein n=1 Tax=Enterocloster alcoholdehydrogenati TaxID=2547410 RepID=A0ABQ0AST3_9FIRM|nr:hypothetical protein [Enterocloster alcoholdehydrogenati]MBS7140267.1 hypothetical protein [Clostridiales bacterium]
MPLPPSILKKLQQATCDRPDLDRKALRLSRSFKEAQKALGSKKKK